MYIIIYWHRLSFETEDFYEIMHLSKDLYDLNNFPKDSKYFCNDNKKVPGKLKDEYGGIVNMRIYRIKTKNVFNTWCE